MPWLAPTISKSTFGAMLSIAQTPPYSPSSAQVESECSCFCCCCCGCILHGYGIDFGVLVVILINMFENSIKLWHYVRKQQRVGDTFNRTGRNWKLLFLLLLRLHSSLIRHWCWSFGQHLLTTQAQDISRGCNGNQLLKATIKFCQQPFIQVLT